MPPVRFRFRHRAASTVAVAGDFNQWSTTSHGLERETDDLWALEVDLPGAPRVQVLRRWAGVVE